MKIVTTTQHTQSNNRLFSTLYTNFITFLHTQPPSYQPTTTQNQHLKLPNALLRKIIYELLVSLIEKKSLRIILYKVYSAGSLKRKVFFNFEEWTVVLQCTQWKVCLHSESNKHSCFGWLIVIARLSSYYESLAGCSQEDWARPCFHEAGSVFIMWNYGMGQ